jgi:hypothetical protein
MGMQVIASNVSWETKKEYNVNHTCLVNPTGGMTYRMDPSTKIRSKYASDPCQIPLATKKVSDFCRYNLTSKELSDLENASNLSYGFLVQKNPIIVPNTLDDAQDKFKRPTCHRVLAFVPLKEFLEDTKISDVAKQSIIKQSLGDCSFVFCLENDQTGINTLLVDDSEKLWTSNDYHELSAIAIAHLNEDKDSHETEKLDKNHVLNNFRIELLDDVKIAKIKDQYLPHLNKLWKEIPELKEIHEGEVVNGQFLRLTPLREYREKQREEFLRSKQLAKKLPPTPTTQQPTYSHVPPPGPPPAWNQKKTKEDKDCNIM